MNSRRRGSIGEDEAVKFLESKGCRVIARNYRSRTGEIDIVVTDGGELVFVEVKRWSSFGVEDLEYAINGLKMKRIIATSKKFVYEHPEFEGFQLRYDVVLVRANGDGIVHINNAFNEV